MASDKSKKEISKEWQEYLIDTEKVLSEYKIGGYKVLSTDNRVMLLKRLPKAFKEVKYDELLSIEHYTKIMWDKFFKAVLLGIIVSYAYNLFANGSLSSALENILATYLPEIKDIIPINGVIVIGMLIVVYTVLVNTIDFIYSAVGYLKLSRKNRPSIRVHTLFNPKVRHLIQEIEDQISKGKQSSRHASEKPTPAPTPVAVEEKLRVEKPSESIVEKLKNGLEGLSENSIALVSMDSGQHTEAIAALMDILVNDQKKGGVYVSVSKPYGQTMKAMEMANVKTKNLFFIDCISHMAGKLPDKAENAVFVENPSSLEEVSMYVDKTIVRIPDPKFILLDSLSSLLIYNEQRGVEEFTHLLINRMRLENVGGIIISIKQKEAEALTRTLVPMVDKEIVL